MEAQGEQPFGRRMPPYVVVERAYPNVQARRKLRERGAQAIPGIPPCWRSVSIASPKESISTPSSRAIDV
jgi:hypothetical protein